MPILTTALLTFSVSVAAQASPELFTEADYDAVAQQVLPRDSFPVLTLPQLVSAKVGSESLQEEELVIGLEIDGESRAYPLRVMGGIELVNDICGDTPTAVSW